MVEEQSCPHCGHKLNAASNEMGGREPKAGDLSICFHCATILEFDKDLKLVEMDIERLFDLEEFDDELRLYIIRQQKKISNYIKSSRDGGYFDNDFNLH